MRQLQVNTTTFLLGLQQALLIPFLGLFAVRGLDMSPLGLFVFLSAFHTTGLLTGLILPAVMDRTGRGRAYFRTLTVLSAAGFVVFALPINTSIALVTAICLLGPASAQNSVYFSALKTSGRSRSGLLGARGLFTAAWIAGPVLGTVIHHWAGFSGLFGTLAALNVIILLLRPLVHSREPAAPTPSASDGVPAVATWRMWVAFVALICLYSTNVIATTTMPIIVASLPGGSTTISGVAFAVSAAVEAVVLFALARWSAQGQEAIWIVAMCLPGAAYYALLATIGSPWWIVAGQLPNAMFISAAVGLDMTWFQSLMPARPGLATGIFMNASRIASVATAPVLGGASLAAGCYQAVNWVAAALLIPAAVLVCIARKPRIQRVSTVAALATADDTTATG